MGTKKRYTRFFGETIDSITFVSPLRIALGGVYTAKNRNVDPSVHVSNGISPPTTRIDSHIRVSTWIFE
jgi:hypothetical protein